MEKEKSCGAVIIQTVNHQMQVLCVHQQLGHWGFPKGHVEGKETEQETAAREIKEETGIEVSFEKGFRKTTQYSPYPGTMKEVVYFIAHPKGGREAVQEEEIKEQAWLSLVQAMAVLTYNSDAALLKEAVEYLTKSEDEGIEEWFTL